MNADVVETIGVAACGFAVPLALAAVASEANDVEATTVGGGYRLLAFRL
jgi:hypothetical protein